MVTHSRTQNLRRTLILLHLQDFSVHAALGGDELASVPYPWLRLFSVAEGGSADPQVRDDENRLCWAG
jgi:hypothetical protein